MRNLSDIILEVCAIPNIPKELKEQLEYIYETRLPYCPPENVYIWWNDAQIVVNSYMPLSPSQLNEWQKAFLKIWTGKDW